MENEAEAITSNEVSPAADQRNAASSFSESTIPLDLTISLQDFDTDEHARKFGRLVGDYLRVIGTYLDLSSLDGVTIAGDFSAALSKIERGIDTEKSLTPSRGWAHGIAMTPSVLREGVLKSHIAIDANVLVALEEGTGENFGQALHTLWHECTHVEINAAFDRAFPGVLLKENFTDLVQSLKWKIIFPCWDEYAACRLTGAIGYDPIDNYETLLRNLIEETQEQANGVIRAYRLTGDHQGVCEQVFGIYGTLLKSAAYYLGATDTVESGQARRESLVSDLSGNWFKPFLVQLHVVLRDIYTDYAVWPDRTKFEALGEVGKKLVEFGGVSVSSNNDGTAHITVPFTKQTIP